MRASLDPARTSGSAQPIRPPTAATRARASLGQGARAVGHGIVVVAAIIGGVVLLLMALLVAGWFFGNRGSSTGTTSFNDTWPGTSCATSELELVRVATFGDATEVRNLVRTPTATSGADPSAADERGNTPLACAAGAGNHGTVDALLAAGADPAGTTADGDTAIVAAIVHCNPSFIAPLIAGGVDPEASGSYPVTPLRLAVDLGMPDVVGHLLDGRAGVEDLEGPVSRRAEDRCNDPDVTLDPFAIGSSNLEAVAADAAALRASIRAQRQAEALALVLDAGADPGWVLQQAAMLGEIELLEVALAAGATPDEGTLVVRGDQFEQLCRLQLPRPTDRGCSVVHPLAHLAGRKPLAPGSYPETPLLEAAGRGHHDVMVALLRAGADPEAEGPAGLRPMDVATERDDPVAIELLRGAIAQP